MKTRNGFVSNSSTSSFLLVGLNREEVGLDLEQIEELEEHGFETANDGELFGVYFYVGEYEAKSFSFEEIEKAREKFRKHIGKEPKIFSGAQYC